MGLLKLEKGWKPVFSLKVVVLFCLFSLSRVSGPLRTDGPQHTRLLCPSPSVGVCSNSCPLSWWCHPTILSSVTLVSSYLQSFPASESFPVGQFFASGGQSIGASASASVLPMNTQDWFPLGLTGVFSLLSTGLRRVFSSTTVESIYSLLLSLFYCPTLASIHDCWRNHSFDYGPVSAKECLLFNMLSRLVIAFLPGSKHLLISWLQSLSKVISEPTKIQSVTVSIVFPSVCHEVMGLDAMIFVFQC